MPFVSVVPALSTAHRRAARRLLRSVSSKIQPFALLGSTQLDLWRLGKGDIIFCMQTPDAPPPHRNLSGF